MKRLLITALLICLPRLVFAQATQFYLEDSIADKWKVKIYVIGEAQAKTQIQESLYSAMDHAKLTYDKLDADNPSSELGSINQKKIKDNYMVSPELARAVAIGLDVSRWTDGYFDITFDSEEPNYKKVDVKLKDNELKIKEYNLVINLRYMLPGFLADQIADEMNTAGWKNCLVKVGDMFVARGNDINGPWRVPVVTPTEKYAKRALFYKATDVAASTVTTNSGPINIINPKTKSGTNSDLKSVTIFTVSAAKAEALATGIYVMGMANGKTFLAKNKNLRAVLGDMQGNLTFIPDYKQGAGTATEVLPTSPTPVLEQAAPSPSPPAAQMKSNPKAKIERAGIGQ
ncbi:MAG: FAD:protein FMN transferase [Deltaproteobacteria bacterium]|nr:FAD:protein FMN transferase [Deltaproteobacteria bacterium]